MAFYAAGEDMNWLLRARSITASPGFDALFPASRLFDGLADAVAAFSSNAVNPYVLVDLALLDKDGGDNGNLDTWIGGLPASWSVSVTGAGTVTQSSPGRGGSGSEAQIKKGGAGGGNRARISKFYKVRTGQRLTAEGYLRRAAAGIASAQIYDQSTAKFLTSGGAWQAGQTYFATESVATAYGAAKSLAFQIEDWRAHADSPYTILELDIDDTGAGGGSDAAFADDWFVYPTTNAVIVPPFYGILSSPIAKRFLKLLLSGTQGSLTSLAVYLPELIYTYLETGAHPNWAFDLKFLPDNIVNPSFGGKLNVSQAIFPAHNIEAAMAPVLQSSADGSAFNTELALTVRNNKRRRTLSITRSERSDAEFRELRDEIHGRCHGSLYPLVFVPVEVEDTAIFGRLDEAYTNRRAMLSAWEDDLVISENPFSRVVPS